VSAERFDLIGPILHDIVEQSRLALSPVPSRVNYVAPGNDVAWDACCDGQLSGRIVSINPHVGTQARSSSPCGVLYWDVLLAVGILRCVDVVDDQGTAPSTLELDRDGQQMLWDAQALQQVILCHDKVKQINAWVPQGPQGGCAGGEWTFLVTVGVCPCDPPVATPI